MLDDDPVWSENTMSTETVIRVPGSDDVLMANPCQRCWPYIHKIRGKTSSNQFLYNFKLSDKNFLKAQDKSSESIWATAHDPPKKPKMSETAGITGILLKLSQNSPTFQLSEMLQSIYPYLDPAARRAGLAQRGFHGCSSPATSAAGGSVTRFSW